MFGARVLVSGKLVICWGAVGVRGRYRDRLGSGVVGLAEARDRSLKAQGTPIEFLQSK